MKIYLTACEVVTDLHHRGFTDDFELFENTLLWVQKRVFLDPDEFLIIECHRFLDAQGNELIISGVLSLCCMAKGILINHYNNYTKKCPLVIKSKIERLFTLASENDGEFSNLKFGGDF